MAKLERTLTGDFNQIVKKIENGILNGSMSAALEDSSDFYSGDAVSEYLSVTVTPVAVRHFSSK